MVADTYSSILGFLTQGTGNNNNNWGDKANASIFSVFERAIAGRATYAVTGGVTDISATTPPAGISSAIDHIHYFSGALVTDQLLIVPNVKKTWIIHNNTTNGAFVLAMRTSGSATTIVIPQAQVTIVYCDGNNVLYRQDGAEVGTIVMCAGTIPANVQLCSGQSLLRSRFPDLFNVIGTTYGAVDGTHFNVPDYTTNNRFLRCAGGSLALGTTQSNQNKAHTHSITGVPAVGTLTAASSGAHTHTANVTDPGHVHSLTVNFGGSGQTGSGMSGTFFGASNTASATTGISVSIVSDGAHTHNVTGTLTAGTLANGNEGGSEARPENAAAYFCIKY